MRAELQNGRAATEVTTPPVGTQAVRLTPLTESNAERDSLQVRVQRFLMDLKQGRAPVNAPVTALDRYRLAQDEGNEELCRRGCGRPVFYNCECATCGREEWT